MSEVFDWFNGFWNPLDSGKRPKMYLGFAVFFGLAATSFLIGDTPIILVALEYGYSVLWGVLAFVDVNDRVQDILFKILMAGLLIYYGGKYIL